MGKKLANAPVYYTVAQVQFNPILNLDSFLPAIQAKMRATLPLPRGWTVLVCRRLRLKGRGGKWRGLR